jgi:hypothetical protein
MIAPEFTTMPLSSDDISEYEAQKQTWQQKVEQQPDPNNGKKQDSQEHRKEVRDRIGLKK